METGSAQIYYYEVKYGLKDEIYYVTKDGICPPPPKYKYSVYFKVESCWNVEDGREAVKKWCIKNIKNYNKFENGHVANSIIYQIHDSYYKKSIDTTNKNIKLVDLKGTYVKPKEIDYNYNPTEDQMQYTNKFFKIADEKDNAITMWNTTGVNEMKHIVNDARYTTNAETTGCITKINEYSTVVNSTEWAKIVKNNNESDIKIYDNCAGTTPCDNLNATKIYNNYIGTTPCDNEITSLSHTFVSNDNPPKCSKDNKEYEDLMLM